MAKQFAAKKQCVIDQYAKYEILPGVNLNGKLTLGENIADLGGVKLAYGAYRHLRKDAKDPIVAEGLNEDQLFFLAVAQSWCTKARDAEARRLVTVDSHSPPRFRVIGSLQSLPEFSAAYACEEESYMNPKDRCEVW